MAELCRRMMGVLGEIWASDKIDEASVKQASKDEQTIDELQDEIVSFMTPLLASNMPEDLIDEARRQLRIADEYESISDYIGRILKYQVKLQNAGFDYEPAERQSLQELHRKVDEFLESIAQAFDGDEAITGELLEQRGRHIAQEVRRLRRMMLERMAEQSVPPRVSVTFNRQIVAYRRVRDHAVNVIEAMAGQK